MTPFLKIVSRGVLGLAFVVSTAFVGHAQQRPLLTEDVDIIPPGSLRIEAGIDFVQRARYPVSGLTGDLTRAGGIGISIGLSPNVEVQLEDRKSTRLNSSH